MFPWYFRIGNVLNRKLIHIGYVQNEKLHNISVLIYGVIDFILKYLFKTNPLVTVKYIMNKTSIDNDWITCVVENVVYSTVHITCKNIPKKKVVYQIFDCTLIWSCSYTKITTAETDISMIQSDNIQTSPNENLIIKNSKNSGGTNNINKNIMRLYLVCIHQQMNNL